VPKKNARDADHKKMERRITQGKDGMFSKIVRGANAHHTRTQKTPRFKKS
jgi:cytochrome c5